MRVQMISRMTFSEAKAHRSSVVLRSGATEVRAEIENLLQHREHKQDGDDSGEKNDEPFLSFRMPTIHGRNAIATSGGSMKGNPAIHGLHSIRIAAASSRQESGRDTASGKLSRKPGGARRRRNAVYPSFSVCYYA